MNLRTALFVCFFLVANARAADTDLLHRALGCQLGDNELALLITALAKERSDFKQPVQQYGAPSADVYELASPLSIYGYTSSQVVVTPARILLAVPGKTVGEAVKSLKLEETKFSPASRAVRPTVSTIAMKLSHASVADKLLVGCEYASSDAAQWLSGGKN